MTGIAGWFCIFILYGCGALFRSLISLWFCAGASRSLDRGSYGADGRGAAFVFLLVSVFSLWIIGAAARRRKVKLQLDKGRRYGIVLEGGGARGAYQIGAWKALKKRAYRYRGQQEPLWEL